MCTGEGDFFHEHVGQATAIALDRNDMFDIYGGPQQLEGPPPEFCQENEMLRSVVKILDLQIFLKTVNMFNQVIVMKNQMHLNVIQILDRGVDYKDH